MNVMHAPSPHNQWSRARNGRRYAPLTDPECSKFVELGHLQPTDLLWREGFSEWRPALAVFPPQGAGAAGRKEANAKPGGAPLPTPLAAERALGAAPAPAEGDDDLEGGRRRFGGRLRKVHLLIALGLAAICVAL